MADPRPSRAQLRQFLSPEAIAIVEASAENLMAPRRLEVSVLSCDVRSFGAFAGELPAAEAVAALDLMLAEMAAAVLGQEGTVMSFTGDGILAAFGAPIPRADHRDRAEAAAAEIAGPRLGAVNDRLRADGANPLEIATGLASGPALAAPIGTPERIEYAVLGAVTSRAIGAASSAR